MALLELERVAFGGTPAIIALLQSKNVLVKEKKCATDTMMTLQPRDDISDGCRLRRPDCYKTISIRKGSFVEKSKLTFQKWLMHW